jgi:hypothetical protein
MKKAGDGRQKFEDKACVERDGGHSFRGTMAWAAASGASKEETRVKPGRDLPGVHDPKKFQVLLMHKEKVGDAAAAVTTRAAVV